MIMYRIAVVLLVVSVDHLLSRRPAHHQIDTRREMNFSGLRASSGLPSHADVPVD
jgi:hypothetical protein